MTVEEALVLLDVLLEGRRLKDIQERVFRHSWDGWTYPQIAEHAGYDTGHIRDVGCELWQMLSQVLGTEVTKKNFQSVLRRCAQQTAIVAPMAAPTLPAQPNPFVGRTSEVRHCVKLLDPFSAVRLLTLTGPGGVGKSRLAIEVATRLSGQYAGVAFVPLAAVRDPGLVPLAIAQALGIREQGGEPLIESLKSRLHAQAFLLVLDNFEQILEAAQSVSELLTSSVSLKMLVTSRSVLKVYGEYEYPVLPLDLPRPDQDQAVEALERSTAVHLFVERARAVRPEFALTSANAAAVARICVRLDGLPLAIELAAARSKLLSPQALLARLDHSLTVLTGGPTDLPERQRTLRGTIDWSHALLTPAERILFRRLGVFTGGATLEAIERVCGIAGGDSLDVLEGVTSLVDKSMLQQVAGADGEWRFLMLETLREYAIERLAQSGEEAQIRHQHTDWCCALAAEAELHGEQQQLWLDRLELEYENLRVAFYGLIDRKSTEAALRLSICLERFWKVRGYFGEGRAWLTRLLSTTDGPPILRGRVLGIAGDLARCQGDYSTAQSLCTESLAIQQAQNYPEGIADALGSLATIAWCQKQHETARQILEECLALRRALDNPRGTSLALSLLGTVAWSQKDWSAAHRFYTESLALDHLIGDKKGIANCLGNLGLVARELNNYEEALGLYQESLRLFRDLVDKEGVAINLEEMAGIYHALGLACIAVQLLGASAALRKAIGAPLRPSEQADREVTMDSLRCELHPVVFEAAWKRGQSMNLGQVIDFALDAPSEQRCRWATV